MTESRFATKKMDYYADLTSGGTYQIELNQREACVVLKVHDYGADNLSDEEKVALYQMIGKLKDQIWP